MPAQSSLQAPPTPAVAAGVTVRPTTAAQVAGLRAQSALLRDELARATADRQALTDQLRPGPAGPGLSPQVSAGVEQRVSLLDARILRLERDLDAADQALAAAAPELFARTETQAVDPVAAALNGIAERGAAAGAAVGFPAGVLLTLGVVAIRRRLRRRRWAAEGRGMAPTSATRGLVAAASPEMAPAGLANAVDAIAVEVERIGEGQRFVTQLLVEERDRGAAVSPAVPPPSASAR